MPWIEDTSVDEPWDGWHVGDAERPLSVGSWTEDEEEYVSCDEGNRGSELDVVTECTPSLYTQLSGRDGTVVLRFRSDDNEPEVVDVSPSTLAVFFLFQDVAQREACWYMLQRTLKASADAWLDKESLHLSRGNGVRCECEGVSLVLLFSLPTALTGHYTHAELDRKLEDVLGCPPSRRKRINVTLRRATLISYELVPEDTRNYWLLHREEALGVCSKSSIVGQIEPCKEETMDNETG